MCGMCRLMYFYFHFFIHKSLGRECGEQYEHRAVNSGQWTICDNSETRERASVWNEKKKATQYFQAEQMKRSENEKQYNSKQKSEKKTKKMTEKKC